MPTTSWLAAAAAPAPVSAARLWFAALLVLHTALLGGWFTGEPLGASWREADTMAIAANQARDHFEVLRPRVDWRGDTDGSVECEFPLYQALVGALAGDDGVPGPGRWLSLLASATAAALWFLVLERRCGSWPALFGASALVLGGQYAATATRVIPDPTSSLLGVASVAASLQFLRHQRTAWLFWAAGLSALAMLAKPTSAQWLALTGLWAACSATWALRQVRVWCALLVALGTLAAWLWHARQLGLSTGLTFGVTFGDTKSPGLEHLLQPGLWRAACQTTLEFGAGPFGMVACLWLLVRRRFDRSDAAVLAVAVLGILGALRYSHNGAMGPQYHAFAAFAGSWWLARALPPRPDRLAGLLLLSLLAGGVWHTHREHERYAAERSHPIVALGAELRALVPADALLVVRSGKPRFDPFWRRPNNYEEPVLFWQSRHRGFVLPRDGVTAAALAEVRTRGGRWYIDRIAPGDDPQVAAWLAGHGTVRRAEPGLLVVELRD
jgi:hypothetical protein